MQQNEGVRESKRARFSQPARQHKSPVPVFVAAGVVLLAVVAVLWQPWARTNEAPRAADGEPVVASAAQDDVVRLPLSTFDDGLARFYSYDVGGTTVEFFVLKSSDGVVRAAFNACDVCYLARRGYRQEGDEMVCNNCGRRFPVNQIGEVSGGCNPAPLARSIEGSDLVIRVEDIAAGIRYFR